MIVALTGMTDNPAASDLAQQLALLRASAGSKVLLLTQQHGPAQVDLRQPYDDVVIDTAGNCDSEAVLAAAGVIVVLIQPDELEMHDHGALLLRVRHAQEANPQAQVLVAVGHAAQALTPHEVGCVLVFVAQIASARLVDTLVLGAGGAYGTRHSALEMDDFKWENALCATEVRHLYRQVFQPAFQAH
ncbi:hypothetical protein [Rugamonas sp. DEMB1]|uniref:hypothetical protein n=1 Tax=Rugamonas sp. DEMB1 TaxID=3039386 RepID=UPI00244B3A2B|nr:hypothetical protein [Rugamonas sp. DEMB1]WGG51178.1 hypothetical protein QC826_02505 [Rugamonas sp. DEMB1]